MANENTRGDAIEALAAEIVEDFTEVDPSKTPLTKDQQIARVAAAIRRFIPLGSSSTSPADSMAERITRAAREETERGRQARRLDPGRRGQS